MKKYFLIILAIIVGLPVAAVVFADNELVEEIAYTFSVYKNEALTLDAQNFCAEAPIEPDAIDGAEGFDLYSINTKGADGSVVNGKVKKIGEVLGCTQRLGGGLYDAYYQVTLGTKNPKTLELAGFCQIMEVDVPEPGIYPMVCGLSVVLAPPGYIGGLWTSNALVGAVTELGYKTGVNTIRIFKERDASDFD